MNKKAAHTRAISQVKNSQPDGKQFHEAWFYLLAVDTNPLHTGDYFCTRKEPAYDLMYVPLDANCKLSQN